VPNKFPPVPEPQRSLESHQEAILALKEGYETVTRQRSRNVELRSCPTWAELVELGIVTMDQVNFMMKR